jgi:hypothetical protein
VTSMTRLVLTTDASAAGAVKEAGRADIAVDLAYRFVSGLLPSDAELAATLAVRKTQKSGSHWLDHVSPGHMNAFGGRDFGLIELCQRCETVELWFETEPNAQLVLIWLLDYLHSHAEGAAPANMFIRHVDVTLGDAIPEQLAKRQFPVVAITNTHLEIATRAWQAYRQPTPQAWSDLLDSDVSILPQLRRGVLELLEELPGRTTGLGASEMRILELVSAGYRHPFDLFPHYRQRFQRRVFDYWETGALLEGLALAPSPALSGLAEWPFTLEMHNDRDRHARYKASEISLTALGKAILNRADDFSRHNPIHRWWGGTELTNDRLWRWDPVLIAP